MDGEVNMKLTSLAEKLKSTKKVTIPPIVTIDIDIRKKCCLCGEAQSSKSRECTKPLDYIRIRMNSNVQAAM